MRTIWKFPLPIADRFTLRMPKGAQVLCVQAQRNAPYLWALCYPSALTEDRAFLLADTGHLRDDLEIAGNIGSFQLDGGQLVFHLFEQ